MRCKRCNHLKVAEGRRRYCNACAALALSEAQERAMDRFKKRHPHYWAERWAERQGAR